MIGLLGSDRLHCWYKAVFQYGFQFFNIGRATGIHNGSSLPEEIWAEQARSNDSERLHIGLPQVVECMNGPARNETRFSRADFHWLSLYGERDDAIHSVDGF